MFHQEPTPCVLLSAMVSLCVVLGTLPLSWCALCWSPAMESASCHGVYPPHQLSLNLMSLILYLLKTQPTTIEMYCELWQVLWLTSYAQQCRLPGRAGEGGRLSSFSRTLVGHPSSCTAHLHQSWNAVSLNIHTLSFY